ncbi:glycoside hydrolase family 88 protein [Virgisporangium ochraceum]|uniref:glycoside hydrolase family 88 protein n=1 Tax=Virgisporangium ochraceum TaxID=65505 RepID=UPI00194285C3|nr:glycoside hydrolase family 88 protein [Virgisporangium ochraceum]
MRQGGSTVEIDEKLTPTDLLPKIDRLWAASGGKIESIEQTCPPSEGAPVFTVDGRYTARGWTEWTEGFRYGAALLQFDATGDERFLTIGRDATFERMASHVSHVGVHDHGFTNVSTYGALLRLLHEGRVEGDRAAYEIALKVSGAVQAARWRTTADGTGYIYSFNGPQSLFVDTIRSCRALAMAHQLGHVLMGEQDKPVSLLGRLVEHAANTAKWNIFHGTGRDRYDVRGRTAHESIFNVNDGAFRCPSTQQGYSAFTTWTRGLAWAMAGYPELLEWVATRSDEELETVGGRESVTAMMLDAATATCDFYLANTPTDGVPYWDTGAPGLAAMGDYLDRPADPFNDHEPVDSSAAAIAAQGLLRLGRYLGDAGTKYWQAGLTVCDTLFGEPYLSTDPSHQGLLLHSVYHWPNGWDHVAPGQRVPNGEACMWGDYHLREVALYVGRVARDEPYYTFFGGSR